MTAPLARSRPPCLPRVPSAAETPREGSPSLRALESALDAVEPFLRPARARRRVSGPDSDLAGKLRASLAPADPAPRSRQETT